MKLSDIENNLRRLEAPPVPENLEWRCMATISGYATDKPLVASVQNLKIAAIAAIMLGLGGYGVLSQQTSVVSSQPVVPSATPTPSPLIGKPAPAWNIPAGFWANTSVPISPKDLKGHVVLLEFFRTGCPHCQAAIPDMNLIYNTYRPKGLRMIAFESAGSLADPSNPENNWQDVQDKVLQWGIAYPIAFDKDGSLFKNRYQGELYPTVVVLDKLGIVRFYGTGHDDRKQAQLVHVIDRELNAK